MMTHMSEVMEIKISSNHSSALMTITKILCSGIANGRGLNLELNAFYVYIVVYDMDSQQWGNVHPL